MNQSYEGRLPYVNMVLMLLVDAVLYFLLAWYLDQVKTLLRPEVQRWRRVVEVVSSLTRNRAFASCYEVGLLLTCADGGVVEQS